MLQQTAEIIGNGVLIIMLPLILWRLRQLERAVERIMTNDLPHIHTLITQIREELVRASWPRK
jgi:hypothetical protein